MLDAEVEERPVELVAMGDGRSIVGWRHRIGYHVRHLGPMSARCPALVRAGTHEQPMEPGVEAIDIPESGKVAPGPDERLLDRVLRRVLVT